MQSSANLIITVQTMLMGCHALDVPPPKLKVLYEGRTGANRGEQGRTGANRGEQGRTGANRGEQGRTGANKAGE